MSECDKPAEIVETEDAHQHPQSLFAADPMQRGQEAPQVLPFPPVMVAVAGCSGSGKTTLAAELARNLGGTHFHFDNYYRDLSHLPTSERALQNFDDPRLIESSLLLEHMTAMSRGETIQSPCYDFSTHTRLAGCTESVSPGAYLLVDGIFALYYAALLPLYHFRVYVDTGDELCFERRLRRDVELRGRTPESVLQQYKATVRPSSFAYVRPSAAHADLVVDGTGSLDWKVERVLTEMRNRGLMRFRG